MQKNEFHYFARKTKSDCHYFAKKMQNESRLKPSNSANQKNDNQNFYRRNLLFSTLQNNVYTVKHSNDDDGDDVPSSHHPNNRVPNNSDPNPKTGPSSRHRNHPNPSRNRRTEDRKSVV